MQVPNSNGTRLLKADEISHGKPDNGPLLLEYENAEQFHVLKSSTAQALDEHGAVLLRDFPVQSADEFNKILSDLGFTAENEYAIGPEPRNTHAPGVYSSTERRGDFIIHLHTEVSYKRRRPSKLAFFCKNPPSRFGETVICNFQSLFDRLPHSIQDKLIAYNADHIRHFGPRELGNLDNNNRYTGGEAQWTNGRSKDEINQLLKDEGVSFKWTDKGLETVVSLPSTMLHSGTGRRSLQTNFEYWPVSIMEHAYRYQWRRLLSMPLSLFHIFSLSSILLPMLARKLIKRIQLGPRLVLVSSNGTPVFSAKELGQISDLLWNNAFMFPWQKGDILILDNFWWGHGRMNVYPRDQRLILASLLDAEIV